MHASRYTAVGERTKRRRQEEGSKRRRIEKERDTRMHNEGPTMEEKGYRRRTVTRGDKEGGGRTKRRVRERDGSMKPAGTQRVQNGEER